MPQVLITGGAEFLRSHVAGMLIARGDRVLVLDG
jgi:nucleoside-diphosphate-sugar epimerase